MLAAIEELIREGVTTRELTTELISRRAGVRPKVCPWFWNLLYSSRQELLKIRTGDDIARPPDGVKALMLPGGWVDVESDTWDLRSGRGALLKRDFLRSDIADIAWPLMRDALLGEHLTCATVTHHFTGYRAAGDLLGAKVSDVREATLGQVQSAWLKYEAGPSKLANVSAALKRIFTYLSRPEMEMSGVKVKEMLLISAWLYTSAVVKQGNPDQDFLTDAEMDITIKGCLRDIKAGLDFTASGQDLLGLPTRPAARVNAVVVVHWAASLMVLLMLFTGLRSQSVTSIKVGDWAEIHPGLFALVWTHGKKREEKIAIIPASLARLLSQYVERTAAVREALGAEYVFLTSTHNSFWSMTRNAGYLRVSLLWAFVRRHGLERGGLLLKLNARMLRRTYVTRELYEGRSIWALRLQLGHESLQSTQRYGKFDLFEHPAEVGEALDEYGRVALELWHRPLLLSDLETAERDSLLGLTVERHQGTGLCRFDCCRKIEVGSPPPCSLCEHLVTGPEFLDAWDAERKRREDEIGRLQTTPGADHTLAQKRTQYDMFRENASYVKGEKDA